MWGHRAGSEIFSIEGGNRTGRKKFQVRGNSARNKKFSAVGGLGRGRKFFQVMGEERGEMS